MNTVDGVLNRNLRAERKARLHRDCAGGAGRRAVLRERRADLPEFLKAILADYKIQDGKFHIAGPSNGGIAAFHVAAANPQYFLSVTAFPATCGSRRTPS
jgi:poly(3-hydroxybutyrate) depolymerase